MNETGKSPLTHFLLAAGVWAICALVCVLAYWASLPFEDASIASAVDAALKNAGDQRRIESPAPASYAAAGTKRFNLKNSAGTAVVFSVPSAGASGNFVALFKGGKGPAQVYALGDDPSDGLVPGVKEGLVARIEQSERNAKREASK